MLLSVHARKKVEEQEVRPAGSPLSRSGLRSSSQKVQEMNEQDETLYFCTIEPLELNQPCPMQDVPEELISHVFSFLEAKSVLSAMLVCRTFCRLAQDPLLWKHMEALEFRAGVAPETIRQLVLKCSNIKKLRCDSDIDSSLAIQILEHKDLRYLNIQNARGLSDQSLRQLRKCKDLRELHLGDALYLTDSSLYPILNECPQLSVLELPRSSVFFASTQVSKIPKPFKGRGRSGPSRMDETDADSENVEERTDEGQEGNVVGSEEANDAVDGNGETEVEEANEENEENEETGEYDDYDFDRLNRALTVNLVPEMVEVQNLRLHTLDISNGHNVNSYCLLNIDRMFPNLHRLKAQGSLVDDAGLHHFNTNFIDLEYLDLSQSNGIADCNIQSTCLVQIDLSNCNRLNSVTLVCPKLKELRLGGCKNLSSVQINTPNLALLDIQGLESLTSVELLSPCTLLTQIIIAGTRLRDGKILQQLESGCNNVTHLDLSRCTSISSSLSKHRELDLSAWISLQELQMREMSPACENVKIVSKTLQVLKSSNNEHLQDLILECPSLIEADLSNCPFLDLSHPKDFIQQAPRLQKLLIHHTRITDSAIKLLVNELPDLRELSAAHCPWIVQLSINASSESEKSESEKEKGEAKEPSAMQIEKTGFESLNLNNCSGLKELRINKSKGGNIQSLFINDCAKLVVLDITCPQLDHFSMDGSTQNLEEISVSVGSTNRIVLSNVWNPLKKLDWSCVALDTLVVSKCGFLTDKQLQTLVDGSPGLKRLELLGCKGISKLLLSSPTLEKLSCAELRSLAALQLNCPLLEILEVYWCPKVVNSTIEYVIESCASSVKVLQLRGCPAIKKLNIKANLIALTLEKCLGLADVTADCITLKRIYLQGCPIKTLYLRCERLRNVNLELKNLGTLELEGMKVVNVALMKKLSQSLPALSSLHLHDCETISPDAIAAAHDLFPKLSKLLH